MKNKLDYKLLNALIVVAILYILISTYSVWGGFVHSIYHILLPFLISFVMAYAFHPLVKKLESKNVKRPFAIFIVVSLILLFTVGLCCLTFPLLYEQLLSFTKLIGNFFHHISDKFNVDLGMLEKTVTDNLNLIVKDISKYVSDGAIKFIFTSINIVTNVLVISILFVYFLVYMDKIRKKIKDFFSKFSKKTYNYIKEMDYQMSQYFRGLILVIIVQFFEYCLAFLIIGHPNWFLLGVLASVTTVIPYFGGIIVNIIALIIASAVSMPLFIATAALVIICPTLDGYVISPKIYGKTNNVNPIWIIVSVVIGSQIGGIIGIIVSLPLFLLIQGTVKYYKEDIIKYLKKVTNW